MGIVDNIRTLTMFCESLENRARTMSNEMIKIDMLVSSALELRPDIDRVARAENFIEDGKLIVFPGNLGHSALPYYGDKDRIVISFNTEIIDKKSLDERK